MMWISMRRSILNMTWWLEALRSTGRFHFEALGGKVRIRCYTAAMKTRCSRAMESRQLTPILALIVFACPLSVAQNAPPAAGGRSVAAAAAALAPAAGGQAGGQPNANDTVLKALDDMLWFERLNDIADVDKIVYASLPPMHIANKTAPGAGNPLLIRAYTFIPKKLDRSKKQPLLVLAHQGIHGNVSFSELGHIIREMMEQGYCVIAPDYRGSSGYGQGFYRQIDYGGREVDDVFAARQWMLDTYSFFDA